MPLAPIQGSTPVLPDSPTPSFFYDPILRVLGRCTNLTPNIGHRLAAIVTAVLVEVGADPLPVSWQRKDAKGRVLGTEKPYWGVIQLADRSEPLVVQTRKGEYGLTDAGVVRAKVLLPPPKVEPNLTAKWFEKHLRKPELAKLMRQALSKHLPVSARTGQIEDHLQEYFLRAIRRDAFAKMLAAGEDLPYSKVVAYCLNSGRTDARDAGTEPVCRTLYGARTEKERRLAPIDPIEVPEVKTVDTDGSIISGEMTPDLDEQTLFEETWAGILRIVEEKKPHAFERYSAVVRMLYLEQLSVNDIAQRLGVSRNRATTIVAEARRCVKDGFADQGIYDREDYYAM